MKTIRLPAVIVCQCDQIRLSGPMQQTCSWQTMFMNSCGSVHCSLQWAKDVSSNFYKILSGKVMFRCNICLEWLWNCKWNVGYFSTVWFAQSAVTIFEWVYEEWTCIQPTSIIAAYRWNEYDGGCRLRAEDEWCLHNVDWLEDWPTSRCTQSSVTDLRDAFQQLNKQNMACCHLPLTPQSQLVALQQSLLWARYSL